MDRSPGADRSGVEYVLGDVAAARAHAELTGPEAWPARGPPESPESAESQPQDDGQRWPDDDHSPAVRDE